MSDPTKGGIPKSLAERIAGVKPPSPAPKARDEPRLEEPEEQAFGSYSLVNASSRHQQISLELRYRARDSEFLSYAHFYKARFNRSGSIVLTFSDDVVTIKGTNLVPLCRGLKDHRVGYIAENDPRAEADDPKATVIDSITIKPRDGKV